MVTVTSGTVYSHQPVLHYQPLSRFGGFEYLWMTAPKQPATRTNQLISENSTAVVVNQWSIELLSQCQVSTRYCIAYGALT